MLLFTALLFIYIVSKTSFIYVNESAHVVQVTRKASQSRFVVIMMTTLFALGMFQLGVQWGLLKWQFVNSGQTKETVFLSFYLIPTWSAVANAFALYGSFLLADMLLVRPTYL